MSSGASARRQSLSTRQVSTSSSGCCGIWAPDSGPDGFELPDRMSLAACMMDFCMFVAIRNIGGSVRAQRQGEALPMDGAHGQLNPKLRVRVGWRGLGLASSTCRHRVGMRHDTNVEHQSRCCELHTGSFTSVDMVLKNGSASFRRLRRMIH